MNGLCAKRRGRETVVVYVEVEPGVSIHVQVVGCGPPVVLLHGWGFDHRIWDRQVRVLAESGRTALVVDLRGHGRSDSPLGSYALHRLAEDVRAVFVELCLPAAVLVGWSLGGVTAMRLALDAPQLLSRLVLVGSNGVATSRQDGYPFGHPAAAHLPALMAAELDDRLSARRDLIRSAFASAPDDRIVEYLLTLTLDTPSWAGAASLATLLEANQVAEAPTLSVPTTQIIGECDPVFSRRGAGWLADRIAGLEQIILDGCGHYPMIESPDAFDKALLSAVSQEPAAHDSSGRAPTGTG